MRRIALVSLLVLIVSCSEPADLVIGDSVGPDFEAVALEFWDEFEEFATDRLDCFGPVTLEASFEIEDRAVYEWTTKTIVVRVPHSPESLRGSLVHELVHHVERECSEHEDFRADYLSAMGFPTDADWYAGDRWATTPSERFAEATVEVMLGARERTGDVLLSEEELVIAALWWEGR
ncbi:MAG: hypothetical protein JSV07_09040 [Acidimicrobiia bacterium]|jgi:hypothetical protein|nr:MAG: hypothetical protein JSV07_09040 [Acidimicrobiia bacterium]